MVVAPRKDANADLDRAYLLGATTFEAAETELSFQMQCEGVGGVSMAISTMTRLRAMAAAMTAARKAREVEQQRERENPDSFSQTGGARVGRTYLFAMNATWPMAKLSGNRDALRLRCPKATILPPDRTLVFPRDRIRRLSIYRGLLPFSIGLRIEHSDGSLPAFVVFWTFNFEKLRSDLLRLGYDVEA